MFRDFDYENKPVVDIVNEMIIDFRIFFNGGRQTLQQSILEFFTWSIAVGPVFLHRFVNDRLQRRIGRIAV